MSDFLIMMAMVLAGTVILMAGLRLNRNVERSHDGTMLEVVSWGSGFFLSFTGHVLLIANW